MAWQDNALVFWSSNNGVSWNKISDHNREDLDISFERIERKNRMVSGTLRRYSVAKKRTFSLSWSNFPSKISPSFGGKQGVGTVDGGWAGEDIEAFHASTDGSFLMKLRKGIDEPKAITDGTIEVVTVMIAEFSKTVVSRGVVDFWNLTVVLEEV